MARAVVVGAGVGGLAAAARLAAAGHSVTVCEQAPEVGGKLGRIRERGYVFDTGPSLLTLPGVLAETFAATGDPVDTMLELVRVDPIARYHFPDGTRLEATADLPEMVTRLDAAFTPGSGEDWVRLLGRAAAIWSAARGPFLESALSGARDLVRQAVRVRDLATIAPHRTLRDLGRAYLRDPRARMLLERYATYAGSDPRRAPAALAVIPYAEQAFGAWYVRGGLYRIAEALADRARERGAAIRTGADVSAVELAGGRVSGIRLRGGERLPADVVVANVDAEHLYADLVRTPASAAVRRRLARVDRSFSGFAVLLGLAPPPPAGTAPATTGDSAAGAAAAATGDAATAGGASTARDAATAGDAAAGTPHHTVLFPADYDAEFDALFGPAPGPIPDPAIYVSAPDDPAVAPPDHATRFVLVNAPRQGQAGIDWDAPGVPDAEADRIIDLLADRGIDLRDRIDHRTVITPAGLARRTRAVGGAIYGTSSNGRRAAFLRPANRSPVSGLFLAGGSAHPGGGLPLVLLSARIAADAVGPAR